MLSSSQNLRVEPAVLKAMQYAQGIRVGDIACHPADKFVPGLLGFPCRSLVRSVPVGLSVTFTAIALTHSVLPLKKRLDDRPHKRIKHSTIPGRCRWSVLQLIKYRCFNGIAEFPVRVCFPSHKPVDACWRSTGARFFRHTKCRPRLHKKTLKDCLPAPKAHNF